MSLFPGALPVFTGFTSSHTLSQDSHAAQHNLEQAEIVNIATKMGTGTSTPSPGMVLRSSGVGTSIWGQVNLTTDVTGNLVGPTITGGGTWTGGPTFQNGGIWSGSPNIGTPFMTFTNAQHNHSNAAGGGQIGPTGIDWSLFSNNMKSASNPSSITPTNSSQDLAGNGATISFTVGSTCNALVTVSIGLYSSSDYEFRPEIRVDGTVVQTYSPAAALGNASGRPSVRGFTFSVPLTTGAHTISAGVFISAGTALSIAAGGVSVAALVLGNVTA